jgi:hypothetical protein
MKEGDLVAVFGGWGCGIVILDGIYKLLRSSEFRPV